MRRQPVRALVASTAAAFAVAGALAVDQVMAAGPGPVTICMATRDRTRPYTQVNVDGGLIARRGRGQLGPIFSPDLPAWRSWGDIIPPFTSTAGIRFSGQNWSATGQAVHVAGCVVTVSGAPAPNTPAPSSPPSTRQPARSTLPSTSTTRPAPTTTTAVPTTTSTSTATTGSSTPPAIALTAPDGAGSSAAGEPLPADPEPDLPTVFGGLLIVAGTGLLVAQRFVR